jgi:poly-beta-1,6-N-acetyl-D-glucosamine N-deacetylase
MLKKYGVTLIITIIGLSLLMTPLSASERVVTYQNQVAVLMYHHVHDTDKSSGTVTTKLFRDQLQYLRDKGYHFISLNDFRQFMNGASVPNNAVLVTFDDGYQSFYTNAYPVLKSMQIPAVNFIITNALANPLSTYIPSMSKEQISAMTHESPFIDAQCHTDSLHNKLPSGKAAIVGRMDQETEEAYKQRVIQDTTACREKLIPLYDGPIDSLAYPYGISSKLATQLISQAGIKYAFTITPEMATRSNDPLLIPRINAGSPGITPEVLLHTIQRRIVSMPKH